MSDLRIRTIDEAVLYSQSRRSAKLRNHNMICVGLTQTRKKGRNINPGRQLSEKGTGGTGDRDPAAPWHARVVSEMIPE